MYIYIYTLRKDLNDLKPSKLPAEFHIEGLSERFFSEAMGCELGTKIDFVMIAQAYGGHGVEAGGAIDGVKHPRSGSGSKAKVPFWGLPSQGSLF